MAEENTEKKEEHSHKEHEEKSHEDHKEHVEKSHETHEHEVHKVGEIKHHAPVHHVKKVKKSSIWKIISGILAILLLISVFSGNGKDSGTAELSADEASQKAIDYVNTNLMQPGTSAKISGIEEEGNLYKIKLDIDGREFESYLTKDGGLLFPSAVDLSVEVETPEQPESPPEQQAPVDVPKTDKPIVEVFVMSHCPFGTQIEKGLLPVVELMGDKVEFAVKFCTYAMHDKKELDEQLLQHCIQKEDKEKYFEYLACFLKEGKTEDCVNLEDYKDCVEKTDKEFKITEMYNDKSTWSGGRFPKFPIHDEENNKYGIRGSPGFAINGVNQDRQGRDPQSILNTVCAAFNNPPEECNEQLSNENPSSGFGYAVTGAATATGSC